ncbi:hypothetical protein VTN31DRAFT_92 [Thermomyces dupontii]|uniref:uncharacterized protein n=1 Tax=Talaromyces thermophilus TaxID=28565 RepID=UPI003744920B
MGGVSFHKEFVGRLVLYRRPTAATDKSSLPDLEGAHRLDPENEQPGSHTGPLSAEPAHGKILQTAPHIQNFAVVSQNGPSVHASERNVSSINRKGVTLQVLSSKPTLSGGQTFQKSRAKVQTFGHERIDGKGLAFVVFTALRRARIPGLLQSLLPQTLPARTLQEVML